MAGATPATFAELLQTAVTVPGEIGPEAHPCLAVLGRAAGEWEDGEVEGKGHKARRPRVLKDHSCAGAAAGSIFTETL
jgi:hypothetical protein